jgi:hypothetical protein
MATLDMPEMKGGQVQEDFLVIASKVHDTWATAELRKLLELQETPGARDSDLPTITTLVASFRQFLRIINPQGSLLGTFGASLGISDTSKAVGNTADEGNSQKPQPYCNCFCGKKHWYKECYYVNAATQPPGWNPNANIAAKFEQAKKNPRIAEQFRKAAEGARTKTQTETASQTTTSNPIAFDTQLNVDHQLHSMACSFQAFTTNHVPNPPYIN